MKRITMDFIVSMVHVLGFAVIIPFTVVIYWFKMANRLSDKMITHAKEM
jgi:hypothetical protein